jgi:CHAT domain-containing protein
VRPAPEPSKYLNTDVHDLKGVKIIGQQLFHAIFGAFNDPAIQDFLGPDDQATDLILVEHAQQSHWIPFEYLHNGRQFLVLKYALFRTKNKNLLAQQQPPLFDQPLKILLFASNTPPEIDQVDNEITILRDQFHKIARELQMEFDITAIPSHEADYLTWQNLLQTNEFQIIHYAGHCGSDENAAASYLYFWEQAGNRGRVQAIAAPDFTKMLNKNLLLFYLNTCHSALPHSALPHQNYSHFANAILAAGAKAFMGNATAVNDRFSAEFARDFYWQLFSGHFNLAKALQITRLKWSQQTRYQESGHLFWLSPVLWQN